jgi:hypothetical protein
MGGGFAGKLEVVSAAPRHHSAQFTYGLIYNTVSTYIKIFDVTKSSFSLSGRDPTTLVRKPWKLSANFLEINVL